MPGISSWAIWTLSRNEGAFGGWVRSIAVSKCLMYLRSPWHRSLLYLDTDDESCNFRIGLTGPDVYGRGYGTELAWEVLEVTGAALVVFTLLRRGRFRVFSPYLWALSAFTLLYLFLER